MNAPTPLSIGFVCTGNICRSPMGEVVFRALAEEAGHGEHFTVSSRGTHDYHVGHGADPRTVAALSAAGYDGSAHVAAQVTDDDISEHALLIALDREHERILLERGAHPDRVRLLTGYDPEAPEDPDVFDPYYSDERAFADVLRQVERSCRVLLDELTSGTWENGGRIATPHPTARRP